MKRCRAGSGLWVGWPLVIVAALAAVPPTVRAAERVVLGEEFTATW